MPRPSAVLAAVAATILLTAPLAAQHPTFGGTWVFDPVSSGGGQMLPTAATYVIVQHGDTLTMDRETTTSSTGTTKSHLVEAIDGKTWKNSVSVVGQDVEISSVLTWAHDTLVVKSAGSVPNMGDFTQDDRWVLSADGKTITYIRNISAGGQDYPPVTMIFSKKT